LLRLVASPVPHYYYRHRPAITAGLFQDFAFIYTQP